MSITERDIKVLKKTSSKRVRLTFIIIFSFAILFCLVMAAVNLQICRRIAVMEGLTVSQVFSKWVEGISPTRNYSGILLIAMERLQNAMTLVVLAAFSAFCLWVGLSALNRNARILRFIEDRKT